MKIAPIFLQLWNPDSKKSLENLLLSEPNLLLTSTLSLSEDGKWSVSNEDAGGHLSIKMIDAFDKSAAYLSYGRLSGPDELFSASNIIKIMQDRITKSNDKIKLLTPNNVANDLLEFLPPQAVAPLLLGNTGMAYVEMPFVTPFPIKNTGRVVETRMGIILDGKSGSCSVVWRPLESDPEPKTLWTERSLTKNELDAIRGHVEQDKSYFTIANLASAHQKDGTISKPESLLFSYAESIPGGDMNIHSRGTTISGYAMAVRLGINSHLRFQASQANKIMNMYYGKALLQTAVAGDQKFHETPWVTEEEMKQELKALPEVISMIEKGTKPYFALYTRIKEISDYIGKWSSATLSNGSQENAIKLIENSMSDAGMKNFAYLIFNRKRKPVNDLVP